MFGTPFMDSLEPRKLLAGHVLPHGAHHPRGGPEAPVIDVPVAGTTTGTTTTGAPTGAPTDAPPRDGTPVHRPRGGHGGARGGLADQITAHATDPTIVADLAAIKADRSAIAATNEEWIPVLRADRKALRAAVAALQDSTELATLRTNLKTAMDSVKDTVRADRKAIRAAAAPFAKTIHDDHMALREATTDAEKTAAQAQLDTDKAALQAAIGSLKTQLKTDLAPVTAARDAIEAFFDADPAFAAAKAKLIADLDAYKAVIAPQQEQLKTDREALKANLDALDTTTDTTTGTV